MRFIKQKYSNKMDFSREDAAWQCARDYRKSGYKVQDPFQTPGGLWVVSYKLREPFDFDKMRYFKERKPRKPFSFGREFKHGTTYGYCVKKCRCEPCLAAGRAYAREYYLRKKLRK